MRALVIGATGFMGLSIVDAALASGWSVRGTRRRRSFTVMLRRRPVEMVEASLEDSESLRRAMDGCDVVFLAAGHYPRYSIDLASSLDEALRGVRNACEAAHAASVARLVFTSSIGVLDAAPRDRVADERDIARSQPEESVYRAVKWSMQREIASATRGGLVTVSLMPGGCLGPGDVRVGTASFIAGVVRGAMSWWVDGVVNLVDAGAVARAHVAAATATRREYTLAGHSVRVGELLRRVASRYGGQVPTTELSVDEARHRALEEERAAMPRKERVAIPRELVDLAASGQEVSDAHARRELGFEPASLEHALEQSYTWLARLGLVPRLNPGGIHAS